jgi:hypothetical protein
MIKHACGPYFGLVRKTENKRRCSDEPWVVCRATDASLTFRTETGENACHVGTGSPPADVSSKSVELALGLRISI